MWKESGRAEKGFSLRNHFYLQARHPYPTSQKEEGERSGHSWREKAFILKLFCNVQGKRCAEKGRKGG